MESFNYFDSPIKLLSDLYLAKFLDTSTKLSFRTDIQRVNGLISFAAK